MLRTAEVGSNAAHVYGNHLLSISRYKASAMAYLLINRKEQCDLAVYLPALLLYGMSHPE